MTDATVTSSPQPDDCNVLVLSGPSGSGKTTIVSRLIEDPPVPLMKAVSASTRPKRPGEVEGIDYYFLTLEEFNHRRESGEFVECAEVHGSGHWYGTLKSEIERASRSGAWAFLEIDVEGALNVVRQYPQAVSIFLTTSSMDEYERRLRNRGTEAEKVIQRRLKTAADELKLADRYRYRVLNDDLDQAIQEIRQILLSQKR